MNEITTKELDKLTAVIMAGGVCYPGLKAAPALELTNLIRESIASTGSDPRGLVRAFLSRGGMWHREA